MTIDEDTAEQISETLTGLREQIDLLHTNEDMSDVARAALVERVATLEALLGDAIDFAAMHTHGRD
jgi:hypothetical protein